MKKVGEGSVDDLVSAANRLERSQLLLLLSAPSHSDRLASYVTFDWRYNILQARDWHEKSPHLPNIATFRTIIHDHPAPAATAGRRVLLAFNVNRRNCAHLLELALHPVSSFVESHRPLSATRLGSVTESLLRYVLLRAIAVADEKSIGARVVSFIRRTSHHCS